MRNNLLRLLVFAGATVSAFAQEPALSARKEESVRAATVLSSFGLNPATPVTRRSYRDPFPAFPQICTNLCEMADFICDTLVERFCVEPEEE